MKPWKRNILIAALIVAADQILKRLALSGSIAFETRFLSFTLVKNTGSAFGTLQGASQYLIWLSLIFLGLIIYYYSSAEEREKLPLAIIGAGITGNLIDRAALGYVIDFINLHWWPVFNIADSAITIGVIWLIYLELKN